MSVIDPVELNNSAFTGDLQILPFTNSWI